MIDNIVYAGKAFHAFAVMEVIGFAMGYVGALINPLAAMTGYGIGMCVGVILAIEIYNEELGIEEQTK